MSWGAVPLPRNWPKLRAATLRRDGHLCWWPTPGGVCAAPATEVDHRIPRSRGGGNGLDNLWSLCAPHHAEKTVADRPKRDREREPHPGG